MKIINSTNKLDKIIKKLNYIEKKRIQIGWFDKFYPDGTSVAQVALWNEEGVPERNIPSRALFRRSLHNRFTESTEFKNKIAFQLGQMVKGGSVSTGMNMIGELFQNEIKDLIDQGDFIPNVEWWAIEKGGLLPLTHTGLMKDTVEHRVVNTTKGGV